MLVQMEGEGRGGGGGERGEAGGDYNYYPSPHFVRNIPAHVHIHVYSTCSEKLLY